MPKINRLSKETHGFTLIELLVVILVIGVLSGVLLGVVNSSGVRGKARDSQRKAGLKRIQTALELYFVDFRTYPTSGAASPGPYAWERITGSRIENALDPNYIDPIPEDPSPSGADTTPCANATNYRYNYYSDGNTYSLTAIVEVPTSNDDSPCPDDLYNCGGVGYDTQGVCYFTSNP
jgi:prepilin-type N-terminal cleavage/methylation domain-containing protein